MALINCPECGKEISEFSLSCPNCGCPNKNKLSNKNKVPIKFSNKRYLIVCLIFFLLLITIFIVKPSKSDSPFYNIKEISYQEVISKYGEPDDTNEYTSYKGNDYFEYTYEDIRFNGVKGKLVFRFEDEGLSGDIIFVQWVIDGAKYSEGKIEKICDFFDKQYDKRNIQSDTFYEWTNTINNDRIWLTRPAYSKGYYEFEYRPW